MNNIIFLIEAVIVFGLLTITHKLFKKEGVIAWVGIATVLANIITAKNASIFGLNTAIGTVMFASTFFRRTTERKKQKRRFISDYFHLRY